jgi:transcriptional regulator of acetoin/glycerol metabolism
MERLMLEPWPSNVRELEAALAAARRVDPEPGLRRWALDKVLGEKAARKPVLTTEALDLALLRADGNVSAAASSLGVSRGKVLRLRKRSPAK